jgi:hypothetical protein
MVTAMAEVHTRFAGQMGPGIALAGAIFLQDVDFHENGIGRNESWGGCRNRPGLCSPM